MESWHAINELTERLRVDMQSTADMITARRRGGQTLVCLDGGRHGAQLVHQIVSADQKLVSFGDGKTPFKISKSQLAVMHAQIRMSVCGELQQLLEIKRRLHVEPVNQSEAAALLADALADQVLSLADPPLEVWLTEEEHEQNELHELLTPSTHSELHELLEPRLTEELHEQHELHELLTPSPRSELHELLEPVISACLPGASGSHPADLPAPTAGRTGAGSCHEVAIGETSLRGAMAELPKDGDLTAKDEPVVLSPDQSPQPSPPPSPALPPPSPPSEGSASPPACRFKRILATPEEFSPSKRAC